ncbi:hypothetical protein [Streptomyces sp. NPDC006879]|uniref:hypothetical protein n=1 Tax=Streptomyces sp. NPDC006879 TaxID=3364767 RepID=UPI0036BF77BF
MSTGPGRRTEEVRDMAPVALQVPGTVGALADFRRRGGRTAAVGALSAAAGAAAWAGPLPVSVPARILLPCTLLICLYGLYELHLARRMRQRLASGPWLAYRAVSFASRTHQAMVLLAEPSGRLWPLTRGAFRRRAALVDPGDAQVLWFCGDPAFGGVATVPDSGRLSWVVPVRGVRGRERLARAAVAAARARAAGGGLLHGVLDLPDPQQPQAPAPGPGSVIPQWPQEHRRVFRWVVLGGALLMALVEVGAWAAPADVRPSRAQDVLLLTGLAVALLGGAVGVVARARRREGAVWVWEELPELLPQRSVDDFLQEWAARQRERRSGPQLADDGDESLPGHRRRGDGANDEEQPDDERPEGR